MNFRPFNTLAFDGGVSSVTISSWSPTFVQPGRSTFQGFQGDVFVISFPSVSISSWFPTFVQLGRLTFQGVQGDVFVISPVYPLDPSKTDWAPVFTQPGRIVVY